MRFEPGDAVWVNSNLGNRRRARVVYADGPRVRVEYQDGKKRTVSESMLSHIDGGPAVSMRPSISRVRDFTLNRPADPSPAWKPSTRRDAAYLDFVRSRPCAGCAAPPPSDPHHFGARGMGIKADDRRTVPLCRRCHDEWHAKASIGVLSNESTRRMFYAAQVDCLLAYQDRIG